MATSMNNASSQEVSDAPAQALWNGKIFDGQWRDASGGAQNVLEKATGTTLATIGIASADDVARAALTARKAQIAWRQRQSRNVLRYCAPSPASSKNTPANLLSGSCVRRGQLWAKLTLKSSSPSAIHMRLRPSQQSQRDISWRPLVAARA